MHRYSLEIDDYTRLSSFMEGLIKSPQWWYLKKLMIELQDLKKADS